MQRSRRLIQPSKFPGSWPSLEGEVAGPAPQHGIDVGDHSFQRHAPLPNVDPGHPAERSGDHLRYGSDLAVEQTMGRDRLNIHGAINLETGRTQILERVTVTPKEARTKAGREGVE